MCAAIVYNRNAERTPDNEVHLSIMIQVCAKNTDRTAPRSVDSNGLGEISVPVP